VNDLDPILELYDPTGTLVASNNDGAGDGHNALITYTTAATGDYRVRVAPVTGQGDYTVWVQGATGSTSAPLAVVGSSLADGAHVTVFPTTLDLTFSAPVLLTSLQAGDLTVNGSPATGVTIVDAQTARFDIGALAAGDGDYVASLAAGSVTGIHANASAAFSLNFALDAAGPQVTSSSIAPGQVLPTDPLTFTAAFSEDLATTGLGSEDVTLVETLSGANVAPTAFTYDPGTDELTVQFPALQDGNYTLT
jgi:methionine-rich copper-binding protein CopC